MFKNVSLIVLTVLLSLSTWLYPLGYMDGSKQSQKLGYLKGYDAGYKAAMWVGVQIAMDDLIKDCKNYCTPKMKSFEIWNDGKCIYKSRQLRDTGENYIICIRIAGYLSE